MECNKPRKIHWLCSLFNHKILYSTNCITGYGYQEVFGYCERCKRMLTMTVWFI